jgi:hypothetical protein
MVGYRGPPEIGFVLHDWPAQGGGGRSQAGRARHNSVHNPQSAIEKLASFRTIVLAAAAFLAPAQRLFRPVQGKLASFRTIGPAPDPGRPACPRPLLSGQKLALFRGGPARPCLLVVATNKLALFRTMGPRPPPTSNIKLHI